MITSSKERLDTDGEGTAVINYIQKLQKEYSYDGFFLVHLCVKQIIY